MKLVECGTFMAWYRTDDLFGGLGEPVLIENTRWQCPRHSYKYDAEKSNDDRIALYNEHSSIAGWKSV